MSRTLKEFSLLSVFILGQGNTTPSQEFITAGLHAEHTWHMAADNMSAMISVNTKRKDMYRITLWSIYLRCGLYSRPNVIPFRNVNLFSSCFVLSDNSRSTDTAVRQTWCGGPEQWQKSRSPAFIHCVDLTASLLSQVLFSLQPSSPLALILRHDFDWMGSFRVSAEDSQPVTQSLSQPTSRLDSQQHLLWSHEEMQKHQRLCCIFL